MLPRATPWALALCALPALWAPGCNPSRPSQPQEPPAERAPSRPADVLSVVHLGRPQHSAQALSRALGTSLPLELSLAMVLGVDLAVLSAVDSSRPIDVVLTGTTESPGYTVVFTPPSAARARSALAGRYRFVHVNGLGERLELRANGDDRARRLPCALVAVPGAVSARVTCASELGTLTRVGRWAAFEAVSSAAREGDLRATVEGERLQRDLAPALLRRLEALRQSLAAQASAARRAHDRPPDYGDPEAVVALLGDLSGELEGAARDATRVELDTDLGERTISLDVTARLREGGTSSLARDAVERVGQAHTHPLASLLPTDAAFALATRGEGASRAATLRAVVGAALRVLGDRVTDREAARTELEALVARAGDEAALSVAGDARTGLELTAVLSQTDGGESARAALARLARAPWLRQVRVTEGALTVTEPSRGTVLLRGTPRGEDAPSTMALGVRQGALAVVVGRRSLASLDALALRAGGPLPAVLSGDGPTGAAVLGVDLGALGGPGAEARVVRGAYGAVREGGAVVARVRLTLPSEALGVLRGALAEALSEGER